MFSFRAHIRPLARTTGIILLTTILCATVAPAEEAGQIRMGTKPSEVMVTKLVVSDLHRSLDFYTNIVGLKEFSLPGITRPMIDDPKASGSLYLNFSGSPADPFLALVKRSDVVPTVESVKVAMVCFKVVDARAAVDRARVAHAKVVLEPREFMGAVVAIVHDPDGYELEFTQAPMAATSASLQR